ncbi:glycosyl hydrolase family 18 protein [Saccharibacillus sp. CPCC 101409]|uniref:glycosyl hydrolase family 18 protein n=1 Tax=Saccharibacillus sp. CPCC 101409 TaxID=3058041 RepID=UPI0026724BCE|nr:glycosyl hydrolase family 18 protein [Saccharibacillus sp. CPCC 101409]MDO3412811.1 glycosyl hydrolase family 18 protein [Saccharibacillus sp. CPCC 101409]
MSRASRRRRNRGKGTLGKVLLIGVVAAGAGWGIWRYMPYFSHEEPEWKGQAKPVFIEGHWSGYTALGSGEKLMLPLALVQEQINAYAYEDPDGETAILTTADQLLVMQEGGESGTLNGKPYELQAAVREADGKLYVPVEPLERFYGIQIAEQSEAGSVIVLKAGDTVRRATAGDGGLIGKAKLRTEATIKSPIAAELEEGAPLRIWSEEGGWVYAQTDSGEAGYIPKDEIAPGEEESVPAIEPVQTKAEKKWANQKINLAWEAVYERKPSPDVIAEMQGVNVVSPTWFALADAAGKVNSKADSAYVGRAHNSGKLVWGLFSNDFEADRTREMLSDYESRSAASRQVLEYAKQYKLDGINIDFENVYTEDKAPFVEFVREFTVLAREAGLTVSVDVTPKSSSEMWSAFLDRRALGETVDFMMLMAYDEHWASSPEAGSVASLPWVESSVKRILEEDEVPASKLVLGIPLYTRVWKETEENGESKMSSSAVGMETAQRLVAENKAKPEFLGDIGQNYVEYQKDGALNRMWIEDGRSLALRVELAKRYEMAGVASWTRGFASDEAWKVLQTIAKP